MKPVLALHDLVIEVDGPDHRDHPDHPERPVRLVDGVSFELAAGETLALVGESGSGKTLTALALLGLVPPPLRVVAGRAFFEDQNLLRLSESELRPLRGRALAMVFQDPLGALHPLLTIERQLTEVIEAHERTTRREARRRALEALVEVGLAEPERVLAARPHELSGGMRQRVGIAMAVILKPRVLLADEPTTALDVGLQAQVLALLAELREKHGTAIVLISHDLARLAQAADRVLVLYAGRAVESARADELLRGALHPYTRGLIESQPRLDSPLVFPLASIPGAPPTPAALPPGCAFHPRCALAHDACRAAVPQLAELRVAPGRRSACIEAARLLAETAAP